MTPTFEHLGLRTLPLVKTINIRNMIPVIYTEIKFI